MLSELERTAIRAAVERLGDRRAAAAETLAMLQRERGWVSDEALAEAAMVLGMPREELETVATAFELVFRRRVGRHVIMACDSVSCWIKGADSIVALIKERLGIGFGETSADGEFTLLPAGCLGLCEQAPAMTLDGLPYGRLDAKTLDEIFARIGEDKHGDFAH